jgi:uncharacterized membrane protein YhiD involved in acid resistance
MFTMFVPIDFLAVKLPDFLTDPSVKDYGLKLAILSAFAFILGLERFAQKCRQFPTIITTFILASIAFLSFLDSAQSLIYIATETSKPAYGLIDPTRMSSSIVTAAAVLSSFPIYKNDNSATGINTAMTFMGLISVTIQVGNLNFGKAFITIACIVFVNLAQKPISHFVTEEAKKEAKKKAQQDNNESNESAIGTDKENARVVYVYFFFNKKLEDASDEKEP